MVSTPNTANSTALDGKSDVVVPFKTLAASEKPDNAIKPRKPGKERGVWQEHGKWAASAGTNPVTGQREREQGFSSMEEAREWRAKTIAGLATASVERRQRIRELSGNESIDAADALDQLYKAGFVGTGLLTTVATDYIERHPQAKQTTVKEFFVTWIERKQTADRRTRTIRSAKSTIAPFIAKFGSLPLTEVRILHIEAFVFDPEVTNPTTRRNRGVIVTNFFNVAQKRGLVGSKPSDHPCFGLDLPPKPEGDPDPWSIAEFRTLLSFALRSEDRFHCSAYVVLGAYAGIRTEELLQLRFRSGEIDIDEGLVTVGEDKAKKRRTRTFDMEPGLRRFLIALRDRPRVRPKHWRPLPRPTDLSSKVVSPKLLTAFREALKLPIGEGGAGMPVVDEGGQVHRSKRGKVTITKPSAWRDNGLRSAFATYHFERDPGHDPRHTVAIMGHTGDLDTFFSHYRRLAKKGDGAKFFAIADEVLAELAAANGKSG